MILKYLYVFAGFLSLFLAILGAILPVLPTAPFIILAAFFFSRGSQKIHDWLLSRPYVGTLVHHWREHGTISLQAKILATILMIGTLISSWLFLNDKIWMIGIIVLIVFAVLTFIWTRPHHNVS